MSTNAATDAGIDRGSGAGVPGPVDRESFFDAQRRHRRAGRRLAVAGAVAAFVSGIPISFVIAPLLYAILSIGAWAIDGALPLPGALQDAQASFGAPLVAILAWMEGSGGSFPAGSILRVLVVAMLPGMLLMLGCWFWLRRLFVHGGTDGALLALGARESRPDDFEERRLRNVVEELAIAASLPVPRVLLLDGGVANAAVLGSGPGDAAIVVSRELLDKLDRDATQGVLASLVASVGNGDLAGARSILAVFETFGLTDVLLKAPVDAGARRTLWRLLRYCLGTHPPGLRGREAQAVAGLLDRNAWNDEPPPHRFVVDGEPQLGRLDGCLLPAVGLLPFFAMLLALLLAAIEVPGPAIRLSMYGLAALAAWVLWRNRAYLAYKFRRGIAGAAGLIAAMYRSFAGLPQLLMIILVPMLLEPIVAALWRRRRYLADAMAVQLTRNPDGIARGLRELQRRSEPVPRWAAPVFVMAPSHAGGSEQPGRAAAGSGRLTRNLFHPPLERRMRKLVRLGASPAVAFPQPDLAGPGQRNAIARWIGGAIDLLSMVMLTLISAAAFVGLLTVILLVFSLWFALLV